jgi:hypothetical protein
VVRLSKEALATERGGDLFVAGELLAVVERDSLDDLVLEQTQDFGSDLVSKFRFRITHLGRPQSSWTVIKTG